jgi:CRISPR-associated protein Csm2
MKEQPKSPIEVVVKTDDPKALVREAKALAQQLQKAKGSGEEKKATKTQVRRLFGTLRQIEMSWPRQAETDKETQERDDAYRELVLFGPRLAYQAERHEGLKQLAKVIQDGIRAVDKEDRKTLQRLVQFFEATVAYYVAGPEEGGA